jgi:hypothetical protein
MPGLVRRRAFRCAAGAVLTKTVSVGPLPELPSLPDVMKIDASLDVASTPGATPTDGVFITFLRCNFTSWWELPAGKNTFVGGLVRAIRPPTPRCTPARTRSRDRTWTCWSRPPRTDPRRSRCTRPPR